MERITISLDEELAQAFDELIAARGYSNRSEAVRDMLRAQLEELRQARNDSQHCIANLSYVYNHHERDLAERLVALQHDHHDITISSMHAHLDHEHCIESVILRGPTDVVRRFANSLIAERGVRHGLLNLVSVTMKKDLRSRAAGHRHDHGGTEHPTHVHVKPRS
ncbi:MAG: nickel-responsive transcriptional regulator NikR [Betaproteobacteria bacterium]|nr:nickel-responsive transcriptional regulator NikR [Betaproteobacteria bacterium]